jgi:hypothetical protein
MLAEVGNRRMFPLEKPMTVAEFQSNGGTPLKAIKRFCLDCSGHSKAAVQACPFAACKLHPYRNGKNPNRRMGPEQRAIASERLKASIGRAKPSEDEKSPVGKTPVTGEPL